MKIFICILAVLATAMSESSESLQEVLKTGNDQFTAKMFNEVSKEQSGKSYVLSAFSVLSPLAQLALASVGPSHDEILKAIGMPNDNVTKEVFSDANTRLRSVKGVELKQANKLYVRSGYSLNDDYAVISKDVFNSEVQNIDFKKQQEAADEINAWVEDHTNKRIKKLVSPDSLTAATAAVLVNAIYFKGKWNNPFDKSATRDREFFVTRDNKVTIPMMHQTEYFKYGESEDLDAKFLELPYEEDETSFVVILPNQKDGIESLIEKLKDPAAFDKGRNNMFFDEVIVSLPKFKIETTTDLKTVLQKMDIQRLFVEDLARLDNLIKGEENLSVSDATQKAFIEVNEEGAEAAAANQFGIAFATSIIQRHPQTFEADHPFVFFLMEKNNILFNGVFRS